MRQLYSFNLTGTAASRFKYLFFTLVIFSIFALKSYGQIGYSFTPSSGTFNEITGTTMSLSGGDPDMGWFNGIDLPFTFNFAGTDYYSISASTKGWFTFDQDLDDCYFENNLTSGGMRPIVAPLWDDIALFYETDFSYTTIGTPGSQIFVIQWLNMKWDYSNSDAVISFQVRLHETTGQIEFVYREEYGSVSYGSASIGLAAVATGINNFISLQNTSPTATASTTVETTTLDTKPATGQVFTFSPITGPEIEILSANPAVAPGSIIQASLNNIIYRFDINVTQAPTTLTGLQITTSGTYLAADLANLAVYYSTDPTLTVGVDRRLARKTSGLGPGLQVFSGFLTQEIQPNTTGYIFITTDLRCVSTNGNTISVNAVTPADVTFSEGDETATTYAGGIQTIQSATPLNVINPSAASGESSAVLTWSVPSGCYDEIMIVGKLGSSITGIPTGDGSLYTPSLAFGPPGTEFDGGYVVYEGTVSPQTVTNLTPGNTYFFKFFTRKNSLWSAGIETSVDLTQVSPGDFRSNQNGNWNELTTWVYFNGSAWVAATSTPTSASGSITILNGHTVTVTANVTVDQVIVNAGGTLAVSQPASLTIANGTGTDCSVSGTISNGWTITGAGALVFNATGVYKHSRNGGSIPAATWNSGSTCRIMGMTNQGPSNLNQSFQNFEWNSTGQTSTFSLGPMTVLGTFFVVSTGSGGIRAGGDSGYANYVQSGGTFYILNNSTPRTITVTNFTLSGGTFNMSSTNSTTGTLMVSGNFNYTNGTITESADNRGLVVFNGNGTMQTYTSTRDIIERIDFTINPGAYLQMAADATYINGRGTFTVSNGGTLGISSPDGITSGGATGNIRTTLRVFNTGGNYLYTRQGAQVTGSGLPTAALTGTVTVATGTTLTATNPITSNGSLTVNGILTPGAEDQVVGGTGTLAGTGTVKVTRLSEPAEFLAQYTIANKTLSGLTVEYAVSDGGQIISNASYGNLLLSNTAGQNYLSTLATVTGTMTTSAGSLSIEPGGFLTAANVINGGSIYITGSGKATVTSFTNNGELNLGSTAPNENASLILDNYSGTGITNVEIFLTGGGDPDYKWHYVAVPTQMDKSVFTSLDPDENLMLYDESLVSTDINEGWLWHADGGITYFNDLFVKKGYAYYHQYPSVTVNLYGLTSLLTTMGTVNLDYTGSDQVLHGWNMVGNSLTCSLDWNLTGKSAGVDATIYYLKDYKEATYLQGVGGINGGTKDIPPLQGFMVKANSAGQSLNFINARQHTTQERYKKGASSGKGPNDDSDAKSAAVPLIKLMLNNLVDQDETLVWFGESATAEFDGDHDARKFFDGGSFDQIYSFIGTEKIGINGLPMPGESTIVPLGLRANASGTSFKLKVTQLQGLDGYNVTLTDKYNSNTITDLKTNQEYTFSSNEGTFTDRFVLTFSNILTDAENDMMLSQEPFKVYTTGSYLNITLDESAWEGRKGIVNIYNLSGNKVFTENNVEWGFGERKQFNLNLPKGMYIVEIKSEKERFVSKINLIF